MKSTNLQKKDTPFFFFLVLLNHALLPVTEVWDETPYIGSLFDYVVLGESKKYIEMGAILGGLKEMVIKGGMALTT